MNKIIVSSKPINKLFPSIPSISGFQHVSFSFVFFSFNKKQAIFHFFVIFYVGHPTPYVTFSVRPYICPSIHPSVMHHISGTVHHLILIFGTYV